MVNPICCLADMANLPCIIAGKQEKIYSKNKAPTGKIKGAKIANEKGYERIYLVR